MTYITKILLVFGAACWVGWAFIDWNGWPIVGGLAFAMAFGSLTWGDPKPPDRGAGPEPR